jgi:hypothetical protein
MDLSVPEAARLLGRSERTLRKVAERAAAEGAPSLRQIRNAWVAPEEWWRQRMAAVPVRRRNRTGEG